MNMTFDESALDANHVRWSLRSLATLDLNPPMGVDTRQKPTGNPREVGVTLSLMQYEADSG